MTQDYIGNELELFEKALTWKNYYGRMLRPFLRGKVLEAGAGLGGTTQVLCDGTQERWVCMEPDTRLAEQISQKRNAGELPQCCEVKTGFIDSLPAEDRFDAILYMDVIEHIEDDAAELKRAFHRLNPGGHLIILVPAHQSLYSPFDKAIGHYRRYNRKRLRTAIPAGMKNALLRNLDSVGMMASLANKWFMKQSMPTARQISFWDRRIVPCSKIGDRVLFFSFGKSILGVWEKQK